MRRLSVTLHVMLRIDKAINRSKKKIPTSYDFKEKQKIKDQYKARD